MGGQKEDSVKHSVSQNSRAVGGTGRYPSCGEKTIHAMQMLGETEPRTLKAEEGGRGCHLFPGSQHRTVPKLV